MRHRWHHTTPPLANGVHLRVTMQVAADTWVRRGMPVTPCRNPRSVMHGRQPRLTMDPYAKYHTPADSDCWFIVAIVPCLMFARYSCNAYIRRFNDTALSRLCSGVRHGRATVGCKYTP